MRALQLITVLAATLALAGCPKKIETKPDASGGTTTPSASDTTGVSTPSSQVGSDLERERAQLQELQKLGLILYFDYDKSEIKSEYVSVLAANAKFLNAHVSSKVRLEGHTDERGSR